MQKRIIVCDPEKCMGEGFCEIACSYTKAKSLNPSFSLIRVVNFEPKASLAIACVLCEKAPCVDSCPRNALRQSEKTGRIIIDEDRCTGCGWCIQACDFGAMMVHPSKKVTMTCDLCEDIGEPQCVKSCPYEGALTFATPTETTNKLRHESFKRLVKA